MRGSVGPAGPVIFVRNRQRTVRINLGELRAFARRVYQACVELPGKRGSQLAVIDELGIILVSDRQMSELHLRFLGIDGPTDVITFQHGEIFVGVETARRQAQRFGTSLGHELRLYIAHGLLHLHGFDDKEAKGAAEMARLQERLLMAAEE